MGRWGGTIRLKTATHSRWPGLFGPTTVTMAQTQRPLRHPLARGHRAQETLVSALRHHLEQAEPDAGIGDKKADKSMSMCSC
jgi:hypothetical protein